MHITAPSLDAETLHLPALVRSFAFRELNALSFDTCYLVFLPLLVFRTRPHTQSILKPDRTSGYWKGATLQITSIKTGSKPSKTCWTVGSPSVTCAVLNHNNSILSISASHPENRGGAAAIKGDWIKTTLISKDARARIYCMGKIALDSIANPAGDTNIMVKRDLIAINDSSATMLHISEEAPATKKRKIMANDGIAQKNNGEVSHTQHSHKKASITLLDLPTEIRLQICELAFDDTFDTLRFLPFLSELIERPPTGALALSHTNRTLRKDNIKSVQSLVKAYKLHVNASRKLFWQVHKQFKIGTITSKGYDQVGQDVYHTVRSHMLLECCLKHWCVEPE